MVEVRKQLENISNVVVKHAQEHWRLIFNVKNFIWKTAL